MPDTGTETSYEFDDFRLDTGNGLLYCRGVEQPIAPKALQLLQLLLEKAPAVVSRETMRAALWENSDHIEFEGALNTCVRQVRTALGDSATSPRYVETLPKRGYRFVGKLRKRSRGGRFGLLAAGLALLAIAAILMTVYLARPAAPDADEPSLIALLPLSSDETVELDPGVGYSVAAITTESLSAVLPDRLAAMNPRSLRWIGSDREALIELRRPDFVIHSELSQVNDRYTLDARLVRTADDRTLATYSDAFDGSDSALLRDAPPLLRDWILSSLNLDPIAGGGSRAGYTPLDSEVARAMWSIRSGLRSEIIAGLQQLDAVLDNRPGEIWALEGKIEALCDLLFLLAIDYPPERVFRELAAASAQLEAAGRSSTAIHHARGLIALFRDWDVDDAMSEFESALLLDPGKSRSHGMYALARAAAGDSAGALRSAESAERLDPLALGVRSDRCFYLYYDGQYGEAISACDLVIELAISRIEASSAYVGKALAFEALGDTDTALDVLLEAVSTLDPSSFDNMSDLPSTWQEFACRRVDEVRKRGHLPRFGHYQYARYLAQCGRIAESLDYLEASYAAKEMYMLYVKYSRSFDHMRDEPRFRALMARLPH